MDGLKGKVYSDIGNMAEELLAKRLGDKYRSPKGPSRSETKNAQARSTPSDGAKMVEYEKAQDGSLIVKWSDGAITSEPAEKADEIHRALDMSTYGRSVDARKKAGVHPAMPDPMDVSGTSENAALKDAESSAKRLGVPPMEGAAVRDGAKRLDQDRFEAKQAGKPQPGLSIEFDTGPGTSTPDDEEELLARAGK